MPAIAAPLFTVAQVLWINRLILAVLSSIWLFLLCLGVIRGTLSIPGALIMSAATLAGLAYTFSGQLQRGLKRAVGSVANLLFLGALIGAVVGAWPSERSIALLAGVVGAVIIFGIPGRSALVRCLGAAAPLAGWWCRGLTRGCSGRRRLRRSSPLGQAVRRRDGMLWLSWASGWYPLLDAEQARIAFAIPWKWAYDVVVAACCHPVPVALAPVMSWGQHAPRRLISLAWVGSALLVLRSVASLVQSAIGRDWSVSLRGHGDLGALVLPRRHSVHPEHVALEACGESSSGSRRSPRMSHPPTRGCSGRACARR